jgi:hypothetical protein
VTISFHRKQEWQIKPKFKDQRLKIISIYRGRQEWQRRGTVRTEGGQAGMTKGKGRNNKRRGRNDRKVKD